MATESVKEKPTVPRDLPTLIRSTTDEKVPFECIEREQYVSWIAALSDMLMLAPLGELASRTPRDVAWLMYELTEAVQAFDERARKAA